MKKILIVDDEQKMLSLLMICIESEDYQLIAANSGKEALERLEESPFDLMILDIMMPVMDGFQVLNELNRRNLNVPTIILSAIEDTDQIVKGLNLGAYDYITKPFEPKELVARVNSVLRRTHSTIDKENSKRMYGIFLDPEQRMVTYQQTIIPFTKIEYQLFVHLFSNPGRVYTRDQLFLLVWDDADDRDYRNIDTHVKNLRDKLKQVGIDKTVVETVWGIGYRVQPQKGPSK